jgi:hypothetical protein
LLVVGIDLSDGRRHPVGCLERIASAHFARNAMRSIYLLLSCLGLLMPVWCFGMHFTRRGEAAWPEFFAAPFATWVISGFSWDLILTATACTIWMLAEAKRLSMRGIAWHILLIFAVGICFALPTFLYRREAVLDAQRRS